MALSVAERQKRFRKKLGKNGLVRLDLSVPAKMHRTLRARARSAGVTIKQVILDILTTVIDGTN